MDVDAIQPGEDFVDVIDRTLAACKLVLVLIGKNWLTCVDGTGATRLHNPTDYVRLEIIWAFRRGIRVIPVLVGGAVMPPQENLPQELAPLRRRTALEISHARFHGDVDRLINVLRRELAKASEERQAVLPPDGFASAQSHSISFAQAPTALAQSRPRWWSPRRVVLPGELLAIVLSVIAFAFWPDGSPGPAYNERLNRLKSGAELGDAQAQYELGFALANPIGSAKDLLEAARWYRKAAEQGHPRAQVALATMYRNGEGVPQNQVEALSWYHKAADQEDVRAQTTLGFSYEHGVDGAVKDEGAAAAWYRKAAEQGDMHGQVQLARMYADGRGVARDDDKAVEWYLKAATQGDRAAQVALGEMYDMGRASRLSEADALKWYRAAAAQGEEKARAVLKQKGIGQ